MDEAIKIYLLLGLVIILLIIRIPLKRYLGRKAEAAGRRAGVALDREGRQQPFRQPGAASPRHDPHLR